MDELIKECERLKEKNGENYFIFDKKITNQIDLHFSKNDVQIKRDIIINGLLSSDLYCIGSLYDLYMLPSREIFYDTETKESCKYKRYKKVLNFILSLGTKEGPSNFGQEYEQSFIIETKDIFYKFIIKPNCFIEIIISSEENPRKTIYRDFYNEKKIINIISEQKDITLKSVIRDYKIKNIINH